MITYTYTLHTVRKLGFLFHKYFEQNRLELFENTNSNELLIWKLVLRKLMKNTWFVEAKILDKKFEIQPNSKVNFLQRNAEMTPVEDF